MKVTGLQGYRGYRAFTAFHKLMLGLKMLPSYMGESYEDFFSRVSEMDEAGQETLIREAAIFVDLESDEFESLMKCATDPNGIPFTSANIPNLKPDQVHEIIVAVCKEIAKIKIDLVSDKEKKNLKVLA